MNVENAKAQMRKGILEYCILSILSKNDAYASDIIKELKEAKLIVVDGTRYPLLTRQKNAGLLGYRWEESTQGPPRKYYTITETGQKFLEDMNLNYLIITKQTGISKLIYRNSILAIKIRQLKEDGLSIPEIRLILERTIKTNESVETRENILDRLGDKKNA